MPKTRRGNNKGRRGIVKTEAGIRGSIETRTVHPLSKQIRKKCASRQLQLYSGRCQTTDLVKFVKQRRAISFNPSYTIDELINIFDKSTTSRNQHKSNSLTSFDLMSIDAKCDDQQTDCIKCQEIRFFDKYTLLKYDMDFETIRAWKEISKDMTVRLRNPSFKVDMIGAVTGSTWLIMLMYYPLALAMAPGNVVDTRHMATEGISGMKTGAPIGAILGSVFGPAGFAIGGLMGSLFGTTVGYGGCYLDRIL